MSGRGRGNQRGGGGNQQGRGGGARGGRGGNQAGRGGGFVVQGKVQHVDMAGEPSDIVTLSSDEEDIVEEGRTINNQGYNYNSYGGYEDEEGANDEIQLMRIRPKSRSEAATERPNLALNAFGIDVCYDSAAIFSAVSTADYSSESNQEAWSLDTGVKQGYVKEYVEKNGLGMIFSVECGLILFSDRHLYTGPEGTRDPNAGNSNIGAGSQVSFICYQVQSSKCRGWVTEDGFMRQAAAVWEPKEGDNNASQNLLREITTDSHKKALKKDFDAFLSHIKENRFLPIALVRARGKISGYLNHKIGIIETEDGRRPNCKVLFHSSDVYMFKTPVALSTRKEPIDVLLPVGLNISFDARSLRGDDPLSSEVPYQACAVFAGSWPKVPHPTLLPGGPGTYAPVYDGENTTDHTFYYLQLGLTENLNKKWRTFKETFYPDQGKFRYVPSQVAIRSGRDHMAWKQQYSPHPVPQYPNKRRHDGSVKKENHHKFKKLPSKPGVTVKTEMGEDGVEIKVEVKTEKA